MPTIRRLYLYAVALVSVEVVLWGAIGLARSFFAGAAIGGSVAQLAGALSLILVGVPVFLIHWLLAQRLALHDPEERSARLRAIFLYGALLALLLPAAQNALALFNRLFLSAFGQPLFRVMFGASQTTSDNLVAILFSLAVAAYFYTVLLSDWRAAPQGDSFPEVRRLYRYIWMFYGLLLVFFGVQQVLLFILTSLGEVGAGKPTFVGTAAMLANGLALLLVGVPIWVFAWVRIQRSLDDPAEAGSLLRLVALYLLAFASLGAGLVSAGLTLYGLLRFALGEAFSFAGLMGEIADPLSVLIPAALVWAYYGRILRREVHSLPDESRRDEPRRADLRWLYAYILAAIGLAATFIGLYLLLSFLLELLLDPDVVWGFVLRNNLAAALSTLAVGLPLWLLAWLPMVKEAAVEGESGDRARRCPGAQSLSLPGALRRCAGRDVQQRGAAVPGHPGFVGPACPGYAAGLRPPAGAGALVCAAGALPLAGAAPVDNRLAERSLARRHAQFPVLVLAPDEGDFARLVWMCSSARSRNCRWRCTLTARARRTRPSRPRGPCSCRRSCSTILPRLCACGCRASTVPAWCCPPPAQGWQWVASSAGDLASHARQAARLVRRLAEGEAMPQTSRAPSWMIVVYILAAIAALEIIGISVTFVLSLFIRM